MNLLFDLDGTLTNPFQGITRSISHALVKMGKAAPSRQDLRWCIGPPLKNSFATLLATDDEELAQKALVLYRQRFGSIGLFENEVYAGIPEALKALQQSGHTLYVATSKPKVFAVRIIDHFNLRQYFKEIYGSELDGTRSDKAHLLSHILNTESIAARATSMIGDRGHDIIGANANGINGFGVLWGFGTQSELQTAGAHQCVTHPRELVALFS